MEICPECGYIDPSCWKAAVSKGVEYPHARLEELKDQQPEIYEALMNSSPNLKNPIREVVVGFYAYGLWKSGWVRRRYIEIWKHQKWEGIPMEKHKPPKDDNWVQQKLLKKRRRGEKADA